LLLVANAVAAVENASLLLMIMSPSPLPSSTCCRTRHTYLYFLFLSSSPLLLPLPLQLSLPLLPLPVPITLLPSLSSPLFNAVANAGAVYFAIAYAAAMFYFNLCSFIQQR